MMQHLFQIFNGPIANPLGPFQMFASTFGLNILLMMDSGYAASILNIQKRIWHVFMYFYKIIKFTQHAGAHTAQPIK